MHEVHGDSLKAEFLDIGEACNGTDGVVVVSSAGIVRYHSINTFVESCEDLGGLKGGHIEEAAPDFGGGEAADRETSDDAEVVGAAFEGTPEVRVV